MEDVAKFTQKLIGDIFEKKSEPAIITLDNKGSSNIEELNEYALYHLLEREKPAKPWSKFPPDKIDFPGNLIEKFIEELEEKYKDK